MMQETKLSIMHSVKMDESQNTYVYQPTLDTLELKKDKEFQIQGLLIWRN